MATRLIQIELQSQTRYTNFSIMKSEIAITIFVGTGISPPTERRLLISLVILV